jgi:phosphoglycerate dehydrogenase-like enzyme
MKKIVSMGLVSPDAGVHGKLKQKGFELVFPLGRGIGPRNGEDREKILAALADAEGFISGGVKVDDALLDRAPRLKAVIFCGVGYASFIDAAACKKHNVALGVCSGVNATAVAESASAMLTAAIKDLFRFNHDVKSGIWKPRDTPDIFDKTLGFVGFGNVGLKFAKIMRHGYGCPVRYFARSAKPEAERELGAGRRELDSLLAESDVVVVSITWTEETERLISGERIARMKDGAVLLNLSRAEIVDLDAVLTALGSGKISKYLTDVFHRDTEAAELAPLWKGRYPDDSTCIVTPHTFWASPHTIRQIGETAVETVQKLILGEPTPNRVEIA